MRKIINSKVFCTISLIGIITSILIVLITSCKKDSLKNTLTQSCQTTSSACGGSFETCCTVTDCYYKYNGKEYHCNGTDCQAAATELAGVMCGTSIAQKAGVEPSKNTQQQLLDQVEILLQSIK
jgi:hypothetical protein